MTIQIKENQLVVEKLVEVANNAVVYVPENALDWPKSTSAEEVINEHKEYLIEESYQLVKMNSGRSILLYGSDYLVSRNYDALAPKLEKLGYTCFKTIGGSAALGFNENFVSTEKAVLFTRVDFLSKVNIPSEKISLIVLHTLPFSAPSPELEGWKAEVRASGGDCFLECIMRPALVFFTLAFNTLVRKEDDKGVFAILDGRIFSQKYVYGKYFLNALPEMNKSVKQSELKPFLEI